jgi:hypothetical protein
MKKADLLIIVIIAVMLCCIVSLSFSATVELRETGQTTIYATGDDASRMSGAAWPSSRFADNNNGTVTDRLTGLIWLRNANCTETVGGIAKGSGVLSWTNALVWSNNVSSGKCGLSDGSAVGQWRLPTVNELQSLINAEQANSAAWLNASGFQNVQSVSSYWSSTTYAAGTTYGWYVAMSGESINYNLKTTPYYVWSVRGGQ